MLPSFPKRENFTTTRKMSSKDGKKQPAVVVRLSNKIFQMHSNNRHPSCVQASFETRFEKPSSASRNHEAMPTNMTWS